jgi:predicted AAA+ superfamily ATPase
MYHRFIQPALQAALADTPVVLIQGPRQAGKSTLAQTVVRGTKGHYLTFDDARTLASARSDPQAFVEAFDGPVILDEVQRLPEIFKAIKLAVDRKRTPGRFLLTGSANVLLLPDLSDSLAGRMEPLTLWPLSQAEIEGKEYNTVDWLLDPATVIKASTTSTREALLPRIVAGGFPEAVARQGTRREKWFEAYLTAMMDRDIRELAAIENWHVLPKLLAMFANRVGSLTNYVEMGRGLSVSNKTVQRYVMLLMKMFLLHPVSGWSTNRDTRLVKAPKIYFTDSGLLAHVLRTDGERLVDEPTSVGFLVENFVLTELLKHAGITASRAEISYYRNAAGQEVDFVLEGRGGKVVGIEVKSSTNVDTRDFRGLRSLAATAGSRFIRGVVLYTGADTLPFGENLWALPVSRLWFQP